MTSTIRTDIDLSVDEEAVVAFTQELVRVRSVNDPGHGGGEAPVAELVAARMRALGWEPQVVEVAPGRPNVVAVVDGGGGPGPTLMFEGHTDVVTEGDLSAWTVDPYGAEIRGGRLHGRGSADMKSGVSKPSLYLSRIGCKSRLASLCFPRAAMTFAKSVVVRNSQAGAP